MTRYRHTVERNRSDLERPIVGFAAFRGCLLRDFCRAFIQYDLQDWDSSCIKKTRCFVFTEMDPRSIPFLGERDAYRLSRAEEPRGRTGARRLTAGENGSTPAPYAGCASCGISQLRAGSSRSTRDLNTWRLVVGHRRTGSSGSMGLGQQHGNAAAVDLSRVWLLQQLFVDLRPHRFERRIPGVNAVI